MQGELIVRRSIVLVATLLTLAGLGTWAVYTFGQGVARGPVSAPTPTVPIAMIDVSYIFKNHIRFKQMMQSLRAEIEEVDAMMKAENDALRQMAEQLEREKPGTPNYKALEEQLAKRRADLQVQMGLRRKEFLSRESKVYYTVYQEIEQVVRYYAMQNNIAAVLRFNGEPVNPDDPDTILREINKPVIYFAQGLDITQVVLDALNRSAAQTATPVQPGQPSRGGLPNPY